MSPSSCELGPLVDLHFAGRIRPDGERRMREHLPGCVPCRDRYERHLLLARLSPGSLKARTRLGRGLGVDVREPPPAWRPALLTVAMACVALLMVRFVPGRGEEGGAGFTARGGGREEVASLSVYAVGAEGAPALLGPMMHARQELAFAYRNPHARRHLLVFGVDEAGRVYWYHPSWTDPGDNPQALPLTAGEATHELAEAIAQPLAPGRLTVYGVFLDEPLTVREWEKRLEASGSVAGAAPTGAEISSVEVRVLP